MELDKLKSMHSRLWFLDWTLRGLMEDIYLVGQRILVMALYFSRHVNQIHILFVTVRLMPYMNTWGFSFWALKCLLAAGQSSIFQLDRIATALGKKNRSHLKSDKQCRMLKCIVYLLFGFWLIGMLLDSYKQWNPHHQSIFLCTSCLWGQWKCGGSSLTILDAT